MERVVVLDSAGVEALLAVGRGARELGIQLRLVAPASPAPDLELQVSQLQKTLEVCSSIDAARRGADVWIDLNPA